VTVVSILGSLYHREIPIYCPYHCPDMTRSIEVVTPQLQSQLQLVTNRLEAQSRVSRMLTRAETLTAAIEDTLQILCETFSWRFGEYWSLDAEAEVLRQTLRWDITASTQMPDVAVTFRSGVGLPGQIWQAQKPLYFQDLIQNPDFIRRDFAQAMGLRHGYGFPVSDRSGLVGVITFLTQTDQPLDDHLIDLLVLLGEQLGLFIKRKSDEIQLRQYADQLETTLQELRHTQAQVIQAEKMSSLGQLVAGIAHEINNPANFIHGNLRPAQDYQMDLLSLLDLYEQDYPQPSPRILEKREEIDIDFLREDFHNVLKSMRNGSERIREIVTSLRTFSRLDEAAVKSVDLHLGLDSTLLILGSRLKSYTDVRRAIVVPEIQVVKHYGNLPTLVCHAGQVNQIFMNLLVNAIDALEECGRREDLQNPAQICITTECPQLGWVRIAIADNGPGIPPEIQSQMFNPFFTTKPVGKGTGLGLSVSYQIATETHGGRFYCDSRPGIGTTFILELPIEPHRENSRESSVR
jgi:signal transduction histidine kinase